MRAIPNLIWDYYFIPVHVPSGEYGFCLILTVVHRKCSFTHASHAIARASIFVSFHWFHKWHPWDSWHPPFLHGMCNEIRYAVSGHRSEEKKPYNVKMKWIGVELELSKVNGSNFCWWLSKWPLKLFSVSQPAEVKQCYFANTLMSTIFHGIVKRNFKKYVGERAKKKKIGWKDFGRRNSSMTDDSDAKKGFYGNK